MARLIEVTIWQSVDAVAWLTVPVSKPLDSWHIYYASDYSMMEATGSACKKMARVLSSVHAISTCSMCWTSSVLYIYTVARPDSQFVYTCVLFFVIFWGLRFSHILMTVICILLLHVLYVHLVRLGPRRASISWIAANFSGFICHSPGIHKI